MFSPFNIASSYAFNSGGRDLLHARCRNRASVCELAGFGFTKMMYDGSKRCLDSGLHGVDAFFLLDEDLCAGVEK